LKLVTVAAYHLTGSTYFSEYFGTAQTGRILTALVDALTVLVIYGIGARLWTRWLGLLCAALYAFAVLPIQTAHIFGSEPYMTLFATLALFCSVLVAQTGKRRYALLAGITTGLALACKLSALPLLALPLAGAVVWRMKTVDVDKMGLRTVWHPALLLSGVLAVVAAFISWFVADPYAVLDLQTYWLQVQFQVDIQRGALDFVYTRQFVGTWPVLYPWLQVVLVGVNPLVGLAGTLGLVVLVWRALRQRYLTEGLLLLGFVAYLCLFAGALMVWVTGLHARQGPASPRTWMPGVSAGLLIVSAIVGALAYTSIYRTEHTQVQASRWMYDNLPRGSRVGAAGDVALPLGLGDRSRPTQAFVLTGYDLLLDVPNDTLSRELRDYLRQVDYLTVRGIAAWSTVKPLPWRYPVQQRYYELLYGGQLGFEQVYKVTSYPRLFGLEVVDSQPPFDPNFVEYDHHPVWIFRKVRDLSDAEWATLFAEAVKKPAVVTRQAP
jgi:hypothetical protein